MNGNVNIINWFEIPVHEMDRAKQFYETVFGIQMPTMDMHGMKMAFFPAENMNGKVSGALVHHDAHKPVQGGVKIYLNGNPDMSDALGRVEAAGGKICMPKTKISDEIGYMAMFTDTEGNDLAMHSQQ